MMRHPVRFVLDHRLVTARASDYLDGDLDAGSAARVDEHASICPRCQQMLESLRRTVTGLHTLRREPGREPDSTVIDGVLAALRSGHDRPDT